MHKILVTGGAGFIGSHLVDYLIAQNQEIVVVDKLTYAGNRAHLFDAEKTGKLTFLQQDICDGKAIYECLKAHHISCIYHLAAESHVDNSIADASIFMQTNIMGTYALLNASLRYWQETRDPSFRLIHVSTDEVFGCLSDQDPPFIETTAYAPNSPYSASKAASDHLARAWYVTYGLPVIVTHCSNNFGPRQHHEKLFPTLIRNALQGNKIPIYGEGKNIRDWLYVKDHCRGLYLAANKGKIGEKYCFGGNNEWRNIDLANQVCWQLDLLKPRADQQSYQQQIEFVEDRKGHDWRYAIDCSKAKQDLDYDVEADVSLNLQETISYYFASIA